jgi:TonB family protein
MTVATPTPFPAQQVSPSPTSESAGVHGSAVTAPASASVPQQNPPEPNANSLGPDAVVKRVLPEVSPSARDTIQGTIRVAIRVSVDSSGNVDAATFDFRGPSGYFADRAMQAARQWKFAPAKAAAGNVLDDWLLRFEITRTTINAFADPLNR